MDTLFLIGPRATIYNTKTKKVLLLQRNDGNNVWEIPGGKRENNEDIVDALKREVQEETGLIINEYKIVYVSPIFENHPVLKPFLNIGYLCFVDNNDVIISNEHLDYKWVDVEELVNYLDKDIYIGKIENYNSVKPYYREIPVNSSYEIGDETFSVGYPHSSAEIMINAGEVIGNWSDIYEKLYSGHSYICSSSFIAPGSSGGILTNDKLEVIGITTLGLLDENGGFLSGASISALNFYNYLQFTSEKDLIDLQKLFHKDETTYIAYFNKAKADAAEGCATKTMLDNGVIGYEYNWTDEGVTTDNCAYSYEEYLVVFSNGFMMYNGEIYWDVGDKRSVSFYGYYSDKAGFSNFIYEFSYTYSSGDYYTISCDDINYSTNISLTLKRYEVGKKSYGYTVSEEDIAYCKEQFNYMYEWFMEEIKNI